MFFEITPDERACAAHETFDNDEGYRIHSAIEEAGNQRGKIECVSRKFIKISMS